MAFSKVLAIAVTGFLTWLLVAVEILSFYSSSVCRGICGCWHFYVLYFFHVQLKHGRLNVIVRKMQLIFREELLFFGILLLLDLSGRIPAAGIRNREIYGLWLHGGHDAEQNSSCT